MNTTSWRADPLHWGHGPRVFESFLEPTCPFSNKALHKLDALLQDVGPEQATIKIRLQSQPWHLYSGVLTRCVLAASTLAEGREAAKHVMLTIANHREDYDFEDHAGGPNMNVTPRELIERLEGDSGLALQAAFAMADLDREIMWHCKYARQNGIHVSPTFMVDGLVQADLGSGDEVSRWAERLLG